MEEIQKEKEQAGKEERLEKKEPRKLFMRWTLSLWGKHPPHQARHNLTTFSLSDGRAFNINEARIPFSLDDSKPDALEVTVQVKVTRSHFISFLNWTRTMDPVTLLLRIFFLKVYKHLDTQELQLEVEPTYIRFSFICKFASQMWRYWLELSSRLNLRSKIFQLRLPNEVK